MSLVNKRRQPLIAAFFCLTAIAGAACSPPRSVIASSVREIPFHLGEAFADYRHWKRVNPVMVNMDLQAAMRCGITLEDKKQMRINPHWTRWIAVYVNDAGQDAMMKQAVPKFPVGSIIVKEKRTTQSESETPELLTVMTKMQGGYDPAHGDWQYMGVSGGKTRTIQARGKLRNCQSCHDKQAGTGYVYRNYLPSFPKRTAQ